MPGLGRNPSTPDSRDYDLANYLKSPPPVVPLEEVGPPIDINTALSQLMTNRAVAQATKNWAKLATEAINALNPPPVPAPQPPAPVGVDQVWRTPIVLDQGETPHCVGFGWADWGNTEPTFDSYINDDANKVYYECKVIDGEPNQEDGSDVRSGAKAMKARSKLNAYAFAKTLDVAEQFVKTQGPVVVGTDWLENMFTPDNHGYVPASGSLAGGHCYLWIGVIETEDAYQFLNSWGAGWGLAGKFKMKKNDFASLFANLGEACAAVEI